MRITPILFLVGGMLLFLLTFGCTSSKPTPGTVPTAREVQDRLKQAKDPRKYWIKVYRDRSGPRFMDANRVHLSHSDEVDFITGRAFNAPMLEVTMRRGLTFPALIDTLSEKNWIEYHAANEFNIMPVGPEPFFLQPKHVKDSIESHISLASKFRVGKIHMESVIINAREQHLTLGPLARGIDKPDPVAVLGHDFLKPFSFVQFDFVNQVIRFDTSTPYQALKSNTIVDLPFEYGPAGITVKGVLEHYRGDIAIDVAGHYELAIPYPERPVETQLILGDLVRRQVPVTDSMKLDFYANALPSIGNQMMADFLVTIDNRRKKIFFELP